MSERRSRHAHSACGLRLAAGAWLVGWWLGCGSVDRVSGVPADPPGDAGAVADGGPDGGPDGSSAVPTCDSADEALWSTPVPLETTSEYALSAAATDFAVAYRGQAGCDRVHAARLGSTGPLPLPNAVLGGGQCVQVRGLSLLSTDRGWIMSWVDNSAATAELFAQRFTADLLADSGTLRITDNQRAEHGPVLAQVGTTPLLAFIEASDGTRAIRARPLDRSETPQTVVPAEAGFYPVQLALSELSASRAALAFVSEDRRPGIWLQPVTQRGASVGTPVRLSLRVTAGATVDLARFARRSGAGTSGAAVYSIAIGERGREVRLRALDETGAPVADERPLVTAPLRGQDASITQFGDGYAVAYRALPDGALVTEAQIRLLFTDRDGNTPRGRDGRPVSYKLADASSTLSRLTVRASAEGQLLIGWIDSDAETAPRLKLMRQRFDCR